MIQKYRQGDSQVDNLQFNLKLEDNVHDLKGKMVD